jgi:hypothetical protein
VSVHHPRRLHPPHSHHTRPPHHRRQRRQPSRPRRPHGRSGPGAITGLDKTKIQVFNPGQDGILQRLFPNSPSFRSYRSLPTTDKLIGTDPNDQGFAFGGTTPASVRCVRDVVVDAIQTIVFLFISHSLAGLRISTCQTISLTAFTMDTPGSCYYRRFVGERTGNSELLSTLVKNAR